MDFDIVMAAIAGAIGGMVMSAMVWMAKAIGIDIQMNISRMWGTMLKLEGGTAMLVGFLIHLIVSAIIGVIYIWVLVDLFGVDNNLWLWALLGSLVHWAIGGVFLTMVPPMHPEIPEERPAPGAFATSYGMDDAAGFLMTHVLYGLTVGLLYAWFV